MIPGIHTARFQFKKTCGSRTSMGKVALISVREMPTFLPKTIINGKK